MPAIPPVFTATPPATNASAADYPTLLGPQIGAATDANLKTLGDWAADLQTDFEAVQWTPSTAFIAPAANHSIGALTYYFDRGNLHALRASISRTAGTALVSTAAGIISTTTMATLVTGFRPPYDVYFWARVFKGPFFNIYISTAGAINIRGSSAISYTYPTTWQVDFEAVWIA